MQQSKTDTRTLEITQLRTNTFHDDPNLLTQLLYAGEEN